jgi:hydrogenase-4 membrane subunit HyfE
MLFQRFPLLVEIAVAVDVLKLRPGMVQKELANVARYP